nr:MAG TPA: hypothetical protein [Bacteriophage sp.]DAX88302.1 MAG TPA: hypothetical protein [Caudoviricetes sp.]
MRSTLFLQNKIDQIPDLLYSIFIEFWSWFGQRNKKY